MTFYGMEKRKRSFFERLTGSIRASEDEEIEKIENSSKKESGKWIAEEPEEAELAIDVYQTSSEIIIQTMVAGVKPEDLDLTIARNMITVKGKREDKRAVLGSIF
jgi:HSP20 family molecular chaperone IbpA